MDAEKVEFDSIADDLYLHRVFMRTGREPSVEEEEPRADENEIFKFIWEVFNYAFPRLKIIAPRLNPDVNVKSYFNSDIGDAAVEKCAIQESLGIAKVYEFEEKELLGLSGKAMSYYVKVKMRRIVADTTPVNIGFIYALAFACYVCGILSKNGQHLMDDIVSATTAVFKTHFPYKWIYYDFKLWALAYIFRHKQIHFE